MDAIENALVADVASPEDRIAALCAIATEDVAGDLVGVVGLGSAQAKPTATNGRAAEIETTAAEQQEKDNDEEK